MPTKKTVWECGDGVTFSTKEQAEKHEDTTILKAVHKIWFDGCIECPSELIEWITDNRQLVLCILESTARR